VGNSLSMDPMGTSYTYGLGPEFPRDITIIHSTSGVYDENWKLVDPMDGIYNHHNVFNDFSSFQPPMVGCEGKPGFNLPANVFAAGATEEGEAFYTSYDGKYHSGYYIPKDGALSLMLDVINYNNRTRTVYSVTEIEYMEGKPEGTDVSSLQVIDLGMCGGPSGFLVRPPPGQNRFFVNSTGIVVSRDGYVIGSKGHLHDGGIELRASINGKEVCKSEVVYGGEGHVTEQYDGSKTESIKTTTECNGGFEVKRGDKLDVTALYDLGLHPPRKQDHGHSAEEMALYVVTFAPKL